MAPKLAHRPVKYLPPIAEAAQEPFSAEDVNRLLLEAEAAFEGHLQSLESDNAELRAQCEAQVIELREMAGIAAERQAAHRAEIDRLNLELQQVSASLSWRLTRPLRAVLRLLRPNGN